MLPAAQHVPAGTAGNPSLFALLGAILGTCAVLLAVSLAAIRFADWREDQAQRGQHARPLPGMSETEPYDRHYVEERGAAS